jgi:hypothetical protein
MKKLLVAAVVTWAAMAAPAQAAGAGYGPGQYQDGPKSGDAHTFADANPSTGEVMIFEHNTRQTAAVHCVGDGPRATLRVLHPVIDRVSAVQVAYEDAFLSDHEIVMDVSVTGSKTGYLGHGAVLGPKTGGAGTIDVPLSSTPVPGEVMTIQFGLQTHAGCLPHPTLLGLAGSRFVEGGRATFSSVKVG